MKIIKGSGQLRKLCYCCHEEEEHSRYIVPTGLLFTRIVNGKLMHNSVNCQSVSCCLLNVSEIDSNLAIIKPVM